MANRLLLLRLPLASPILTTVCPVEPMKTTLSSVWVQRWLMRLILAPNWLLHCWLFSPFCSLTINSGVVVPVPLDRFLRKGLLNHLVVCLAIETNRHRLQRCLLFSYPSLSYPRVIFLHTQFYPLLGSNLCMWSQVNGTSGPESKVLPTLLTRPLLLTLMHMLLTQWRRQCRLMLAQRLCLDCIINSFLFEVGRSIAKISFSNAERLIPSYKS